MSAYAANPPPVNIKQDRVIPNDTPIPYTFSWSQMNATTAPGGSYKIADSRSFHAATTICAAEIEVEVGGMRSVKLLFLGYSYRSPLRPYRELHVSTQNNNIPCIVF